MVNLRTNRRLIIVVVSVIALAVIALVSFLWTSLLPALSVVAIVLFALAGSNFLFDHGVSSSMSRRFAPVIGGFAYLTAIILLEKWNAVLLCGILTLFIILLRFKFRGSLRGLRGTHPAQTWAEITFVVAGTSVMFIGWGILDDKWLAFLPIAFLAWGDTAAGIAREIIGLDVRKSSWHMVTMFVVCLAAVAIWYRPFWIGAVGAAVATLAERFRPGVLRYWDDNFNLTAASLVVMVLLERVVLW